MQITILIAFGYGLLSFLSPCVLPLIPVYLSSLVGPEIFEVKAKRRRLTIFQHSWSFVLGFSLVFALFGVGSGLLGGVLLSHLSMVRQISGVLLIILGLVMLAALKVPWLNFEKRLTPSLPAGSGYLRSFLTGAAFPVAWIPCTSWALGGILLLAGASHTALQGAFLLLVYSLGLGVPFLVVGIAFDFVTPFLKKMRRYSVWLYVFSGLLLVAMGLLVLTNHLGLLRGQIYG